MDVATATPIEREWELKLCDCCVYKDATGQSHYWTDFMCYSMIFANCAIGKIHSKINHEKENSYGFGPRGFVCFVATCPLVVMTFGNPYIGVLGMCCFGVLSNSYRRKVIHAYNVQEETVRVCHYCGPTCNPTCMYIHFGCNYPCSLFQMLMSVDKWEKESLLSVAIIDRATPLHPSAPTKEDIK